MARLWQSGFELNSTTAGVEFTSATGTISTTTVRNGTYAGRVTAPTSGSFKGFGYQFAAADSAGPFFFRFYLNIAVLPDVLTNIFGFQNDAGTTQSPTLELTTTGILQFKVNNNATIIGSSVALTTGKWYRVEVKVDASPASGSRVATFLLNGAVIATSSTLTSTQIISTDEVFLGTNLSGETATVADLFFDDLALNDSTGSFQNNFPGDGSIVHLKPSAAGDANSFTVQVGGTAGATNNFTRVDEVTPDDATSYNGAALLNAEDLFNCDNFTGGAFGAINVVAVGVRMADLVAGDATTGVKLEIEKTGSGTKSQSANLVPNSTSFLTNTSAIPRNYPLVTYNDPDGVPWGQSTLDSMQIGYINDTVGVQSVAISTIWVSIDYSPPPQGTTTSVSSTSSTSSSISTTSSSTSSTSTSASTTSASTSSTSSSISTSSTSSSISSTSSSISSTSSSSTSSSTSTSSTSSSISSTSMSSTSLSSTSSSVSISSTSSSFSSTSSSISSTSNSTSSTSFSSTSSSSSTSTTAIPSNLIYTYQDTLTLPTTSSNDIDTDTNKNVMNAAVDDGDYFIQYGSEYMIQEYKKKWTNNTDVPRFVYKGRSTESTLVSPILIQIYNQNSVAWETLAVVNNVPADTDFTISVSQTINVSNYYDSNNIVTFRVYQQVI